MWTGAGAEGEEVHGLIRDNEDIWCVGCALPSTACPSSFSLISIVDQASLQKDKEKHIGSLIYLSLNRCNIS